MTPKINSRIRDIIIICNFVIQEHSVSIYLCLLLHSSIKFSSYKSHTFFLKATSSLFHYCYYKCYLFLICFLIDY